MVAEIKRREASRRGSETRRESTKIERHGRKVETARRTGRHMSVVDGEVTIGICVGARWGDMCRIEDVVVDEV